MDDMLACIEITLSNSMEMCQAIRNLVYERWQKMNVALPFLAYVLTPHYYSNTWLKNLGPKGEKRMKPYVDPGVTKVYLDVVDQLLRNSGKHV